MSTVADLKAAVDAVKADASAAIDRVALDVAELKRRIDAGIAISQEDLDSLTGKLASVSAALSATDPLPDFPPAPEPTV